MINDHVPVIADLPPHSDALTYMSPLSDDRAARLIDFLGSELTGTVLDVGCGWASLLVRVVAAAPDSRGVGIDTDPDALAHGRRLAESLGVADRLELREVDSTTTGLDDVSAAAAICIGASQAWPRTDPGDERMNYDGALRGLRRVVRRGGRVVFGEGIWSQPPTPAAIGPLGGREDEMTFLPDLLELAVGNGFAIHAFHEASVDEWDVFESGYTARYATWLAAHEPDHPDAKEVAERARAQREAYLRGYRGVLGLAYLHLIAV